LELDHVLIAVANLNGAARDLESRHGLASVEGGRHAGWGTATRIVPLGETYLEVIWALDR
jgi:Glyoxalase-like domain